MRTARRGKFRVDPVVRSPTVLVSRLSNIPFRVPGEILPKVIQKNRKCWIRHLGNANRTRGWRCEPAGISLTISNSAGDFLKLDSAFGMNMDAGHHSTSAAFIIQEASRVKFDSRAPETLSLSSLFGLRIHQRVMRQV
jgi:hypothetical protein